MSLMAPSTRRTTLWLLSLVAALLPSALASRSAAGGDAPQITYSLMNLGTLRDGYADASGVNASGQVVGTSDIMAEGVVAFLVTPEDTDSDGRADLWFRDGDQDGTNDLMMELPGLEGEEQYLWTEPAAINDEGHVVGYSHTDEWDEGESFWVCHAFVWTPQGGTIDLDRGSGGDRIYSYATGINNRGQVVGRRQLRGQWVRGFLITPTVDESGAPIWWRDSDNDGENDLMTDLGPCRPGGINGAGQIAGSAGGRGFLITPEDTDDDGVPDRWFRDDNSDGVNDLMVVLPPLPGDIGSSAGRINASGQVVGTSASPPKGGVTTWVPVLWKVDAQGGVTTTEIGQVSGEEATGVSDINDAEQVVGNGYSWPTGPASSGGSNTGYLWQNGTMTRFRNLIGDAAGFDLRPYLWANGINNAGLIVGRGILGGQGRPFVALPSGQLPPPPPPGGSVTVDSITYATEGGKSSDRHLLITVAVTDDPGGNPVASASVSIDVSLDGQHYANCTGTTGADGRATFRLGNAPSGTYSTEVTAITAGEMSWDGLTPENAYTK